MAFSISYPARAHQGFWGPVDSQHNFCEEASRKPSHATQRNATRGLREEERHDSTNALPQDYILTPYIGEFVNTLTNLTYLYYAYHGIRNNANRKDAVLRNLPYLGIAAVGIGSAVFHATMKNWTQWCDDLSMLVAVATVFHRVSTFDTSLTTTAISGIAITAGMMAFSAWHCITDETVMHSVLFAIMIVLVGQQTRSVITKRVSDPAVARDVRKLAIWGGIIFVSGFGIWNIDNAICPTLTSWKRTLGMPWSFVLELHGWWHIFTGAGAYIFIALVEYLTSEEAGQPLDSSFAWPVNMIVNGQPGRKLSLCGPLTAETHGNGGPLNGGMKGNSAVDSNGEGSARRRL